MKIGTKLLLFFGILVFFSVIWNAIILIREIKIINIFDKTLPQITQNVKKDTTLNSLAFEIRYFDEILTQSARNYAFTGNEKWRTRYEESAPILDTDIKKAIQEGGSEDKRIFSSIDQSNMTLVTMEEDAMNQTSLGKKDQAVAILESDAYWEQKDIYKKGLEEFFALRGKKLNDTLTVSTSQIDSLLNDVKQISKINNAIFISLLIMFLGSMILLFYLVRNNLVNPIIGLQQMASKVAQGNLNEKIAVQSKDEIGQLANSFNFMTSNLKDARTNIENKIAARTLDIEQAKAADEAYLASIGEGVIIIDTKQKIILANPEASKILGYSISAMLGKNVTDFVKLFDANDKEVPQEKRPIIRAINKGEEVTRTDHIIISKDGKRIPVAVTTAPVRLKGNIIGAIDVFRDISYEKEIDKAKTEFVSLASHQLRTPLSAINWYAEMMLDEDVGKVTAEQKKYLQEIYNGNQRMINLVNALLDVSRIELGTFAIQPQKIDVAKVSQDILKDFEHMITKKKIKFKANFAKGLPIIMADPKLMQIIIQNLISNAVKYTPEGGKINLTIKKVAPNIIITVKDSGFGIPKNQYNQIFKKLFRADNVRLKDTEGTGLGLYIVKSIVEQAKGKIWFESEENKGTTFYVEMPIKGMPKKEGTKSLEDIK